MRDRGSSGARTRGAGGHPGGARGRSRRGRGPGPRRSSACCRSRWRRRRWRRHRAAPRDRPRPGAPRRRGAPRHRGAAPSRVDPCVAVAELDEQGGLKAGAASGVERPRPAGRPGSAVPGSRGAPRRDASYHGSSWSYDRPWRRKTVRWRGHDASLPEAAMADKRPGRASSTGRPGRPGARAAEWPRAPMRLVTGGEDAEPGSPSGGSSERMRQSAFQGRKLGEAFHAWQPDDRRRRPHLPSAWRARCRAPASGR